MSRAARLLTLVLLVLAVAACKRGAVKPDLPPTGTAVAPRVVPIYIDRYVRIDPALTVEEPIAEGPLAMCPDVAAARRAALVRANSRFRQISEIQGTPVQPEAKP